MAHQGTQPPPQQQPNSTIPVLHSIAPAIFTRIPDEDLLAPFTPPASPVDRLKAKLQEIDANSEEVRANLLSLFRRECLRIIQEVQAQDGAEGSGLHIPPPVSQKEVDDMIDNMRAESQIDRARAMSMVTTPNNIYEKPNMAVLPRRTPREYAIAQIQSVICQGLADLESYKVQVEQVKQQVKDELAREMQNQSMDRMDLDS